MAKGQQRSNREIRKPKKAKSQPQIETTFTGQIKAANTTATRRPGKG